MIKLNERLQTIADIIETGETMADIGTDHGFLPIYLYLTGKSPSVIMADISEPSLAKAVQNAEKYIVDIPNGEVNDRACLMPENVMFRVGDGLQVLDKAEVDVVVIAGMGGKLIRDILVADMERTCSIRKYIFQPRIGQGHLRKWLLENDFVIVREDLVTEGNHIPEIITAISPASVTKSISDPTEAIDIKWRIPPWIVKSFGPVDEFLKRNIVTEKTKLENIMMAKTRNIELEESICGNIYYLEELLKEYENGC